MAQTSQAMMPNGKGTAEQLVTRDFIEKYGRLHADGAHAPSLEPSDDPSDTSSSSASVMDSLRGADMGIKCRSFERHFQYLLPQVRLRHVVLPLGGASRCALLQHVVVLCCNSTGCP